MDTSPSDKRLSLAVNAVSVAVPAVVAILLALPDKVSLGSWTSWLPHVIGSVNSLTVVTLVLGLILVKRGRRDLHGVAMLTSLGLGTVFLVCYVIYHLSNEPRRFGGEGLLKAFYLLILFSHIGLSLVVLPLVLRAAAFAYLRQFSRHVSVVRWAYPIWLYVSATGVIVYLFGHLLNPYK